MRSEEFLQAFLKHRTMLFAFVHALVRDPHAAEDVFQETSMALFKEAGAFRAGDDFGAWARSVARNRIKAHYRNRERDRALPEVAEAALLKAFGGLDLGWWRERQEALARCLEKIGGKVKEILLAYYGQGRAAPEIARSAGMTPAAVRIALCRTRKSLRACVESALEAKR
jgi:RNA polymerase sigma-70 factor (ECF subfamily)